VKFCKLNQINLVIKKHMKSSIKFFVLLCAVTASAALLSACDHNDNPPPPAPAPAPEMVRPNS
jgi:hypothetical protein